ncbi:MAG: hypothetical protein OH326_02960 [Candidatus Parvarchaeota archaeon]|nr:hypothetical protein [Candidatus Haiyanarchaeum thermophilum]
MNRRGISPLIATILLIAITIVVGALITAWATTYISQQTSVVGGGGAECVYVGLSVTRCNLTESAPNRLRIVLANTGTGEIRKVMARIEANDGTAVTGNVTNKDMPGEFLKLGGQEAKPADIYNLSAFTTTYVDLSNSSTWKEIKLWVDDPRCPTVTFTISPGMCT